MFGAFGKAGSENSVAFVSKARTLIIQYNIPFFLLLILDSVSFFILPNTGCLEKRGKRSIWTEEEGCSRIQREAAHKTRHEAE